MNNSRLRSASLVKRKISRIAETESTSAKLWFSVINSSVDDLALPDSSEQAQSAQRYFREDIPFELHCQCCGLEPEGVRMLLIHANLIGTESEESEVA